MKLYLTKRFLCCFVRTFCPIRMGGVRGIRTSLLSAEWSSGLHLPTGADRASLHYPRSRVLTCRKRVRLRIFAIRQAVKRRIGIRLGEPPIFPHSPRGRSYVRVFCFRPPVQPNAIEQLRRRETRFAAIRQGFDNHFRHGRRVGRFGVRRFIPGSCPINLSQCGRKTSCTGGRLSFLFSGGRGRQLEPYTLSGLIVACFCTSLRGKCVISRGRGEKLFLLTTYGCKVWRRR